MKPPITLYLIGFSGTGKYTIAKEVAKSGYKIVDNQLINNPIFSLLDLYNIPHVPGKAWKAIDQIRKIVLDFMAQNQEFNYILTNELLEGEHELYNQIKDVAEKRNSLFIPVKLFISPEEHEKRVINPERKERFKSIEPIEAWERKALITISHPHLLEVDVTHLSPLQAAREILNFVESIRNA